MIDASDICLICHLERDVDNLNLQTGTVDFKNRRFYEREAMRCVQRWRKNGGWLKDIRIYCLCGTKNTPSAETVSGLRNLGVEYIEDYCPATEKFSSGFLTIPYTGMYFQKYNMPEHVMIRIDLDNELLRPFPKSLLEDAYTTTIVGQYNELYDVDLRRCYHAQPFDTSLIITDRRNGFYGDYFRLCMSDEVLNDPNWLKIKDQEGDYWLEEFAVDYMYEHGIGRIRPLQNYQYGFDYPSLDFFVKNGLTDGLYLKHSHIEGIQ